MTSVRQGQLKLSRILFALGIVVGTASAAGAATASWDPNPEPDVAGYRLSYGTQPGVHTVVINVGKVTSYQFNPSPGRYYVVVQAYNTAGELSEKSAEVVVDIPPTSEPPAVSYTNQPPALDRPGNQTTTVSDALADRSPMEDYVGVPGDFDGDGRSDLATYRRSSAEWRIRTSGSKFLTTTVMVWGRAGDVPLPADYNGDRVTDLAVYRPSTGTWHLWLSGTQTPLAVQWGGADDKPVALDHDADGKADLALVRNGGYEILLSSTNYLKSIRVH
jgi:hypothetical protein